MSTIFHVLSNLKYGDSFHEAGTFIEGELSAFEDLVKLGTLRIVKEAKNIEEAIAIVLKENATKAQADATAKSVAPENTWGPTKEKPSNPAPEETKTDASANADNATAAVLARFKVLKEFNVEDTASKNFGKHEVGTFLEADSIAAQSLVDNGTLEAVADKAEEIAKTL